MVDKIYYNQYIWNDKLIIEENYSGQMRRHIRAETGIFIEHSYNKFDGDYLRSTDIINFDQKSGIRTV